ncbi:uncharacterized protein LOC126368004 [Pectinophora gossypiella]|uniref:uncharacterized protein LOC126368004 n=1 Tax=Pectinophora gossypiella TaxID=13191 RepID=UPI00214E62E2|nr:uncharacterized protein LOC126368004 [Pectinophora gossypiella]
MKRHGLVVALSLLIIHETQAQCRGHQTITFARWSGVAPEGAAPVFVYSASGDEESLTGACLSRCRELQDCAAVAVAYGRGNCHGIAANTQQKLRADNDVAYFKKICLALLESCEPRWWALEVTPGYHLHSDAPDLKVILNATMPECYDAVLAGNGKQIYRSAQWVGLEGSLEPEVVTSDHTLGNCVLHAEDKFTEPESFRVSNYYTFYVENQCRHDYPKKIDRCSYEEYYNQTLKHVELTFKNYTKEQCKSSCEVEQRFVCRGFTWSGVGERGLCDLHSEDLVTTGSWLLRRTSTAVYYRRVICLNITVECEGSDLEVTYRPRGAFRGRVYVPGRGERCSARATGGPVKLTLPLYGDCDVNFAYAISNSPAGVINRTMAYVMVMIQNNPIIQTAGDRWVRVGCSPGARAATQVDATVAVRDTGKPSLASESASVATPAAASAVYSASSAPLTMYVVRAEDAAGAVSLGEPLELRIETTEETEIEAYHLVASSRLGDSSVLLLDSRGCPTGQVDFPSFSRQWMGGTQRLSSRFKAFRFPTSHVVRFALMVRFCDGKCPQMNCRSAQQIRSARQTNDTYDYTEDGIPAAVQEDNYEGRAGVVAQGGAAGCGGGGAGRVPLELEMVVGSRDILSADTLVRADHRVPEEAPPRIADGAMVCVHELLLVSLALAWLAVQVLLLLGCCILVNRYRNLAEMNMQKDYQSFDNVGFDTISTHRRVHWPDQHLDTIHT